MKKGLALNLFVAGFLLVSLGFVSAGFWSDLLGDWFDGEKITGEVVYGSNLVDNGDFSDGNSGWNLLSENNFIEVNEVDVLVIQGYGFALQNVPELENATGQNFRISFEGQSTGKEVVPEVSIQSSTKWKVIAKKTLDPWVWKSYSYEFTIPDNDRYHIVLATRAEDEGKEQFAFFDNIKLERIYEDNAVEICDNNLDDDGDRRVDCKDISCMFDSNCANCRRVSDAEEDWMECDEFCSDGLDNDANGQTDCGDVKCSDSPTCSEICDNGVDDDGDGKIDCSDSNCRFVNVCKDDSTPVKMEICDNNLDDDGDGLVDCNDLDCASSDVCSVGGKEICSDGLDNDNDGLIDCSDSDCECETRLSSYLTIEKDFCLENAPETMSQSYPYGERVERETAEFNLKEDCDANEDVVFVDYRGRESKHGEWSYRSFNLESLYSPSLTVIPKKNDISGEARVCLEGYDEIGSLEMEKAKECVFGSSGGTFCKGEIAFCSKGYSVLVNLENKKTGMVKDCPVGYKFSGKIRVGTKDDIVRNAIDSSGEYLDEGWIGLCSKEITKEFSFEENYDLVMKDVFEDGGSYYALFCNEGEGDYDLGVLIIASRGDFRGNFYSRDTEVNFVSSGECSLAKFYTISESDYSEGGVFKMVGVRTVPRYGGDDNNFIFKDLKKGTKFNAPTDVFSAWERTSCRALNLFSQVGYAECLVDTTAS